MEETRFEQDQQPYPLMRIITFGEFALERLISSTSARSPCYSRVLPEEWGNRGPAMTLLKLLLCRTRRRASRDEILATIWPDRDAINAAHALDSAASILRRRVLRTYSGESLLLTTHTAGETSFKLPAQSLLWVDADALLALATQSLHTASQGQNLRALLEAAHALVHGEFLEDDLDSAWTQRRRHTLNGARRRILYKLVELYLKEKRFNAAEELLYEFLEENPTDEDALCRLMTLLAEQERRQEALHLYRYTMDVLHEEQSEPAVYTRELAARIQRGLALREQMTDYVATSTATLAKPGQTAQSMKKARHAVRSPAKRNKLIAMCIYLQHIIARRKCAMRVEADKMYYGNYKFSVELDTGAETGANQLTVWFAEKVNIDTVPLSHFKLDQLLRALLESHRSHLYAQLENEQCACRRPFEEEIASIQRPFTAADAKTKSRQPGKVKLQIKNLHKQMNIALQRLNADFMHKVVLPLGRQCFDQVILQQESHLFEDERFLRDFYFEETNTKYIHNFCRKFASNAAYRQQVLARETAWAKRNALFLHNILVVFRENTHPDDYERKARDFFHWVDSHFTEILALPEYQRLQQIDNVFKANARELDPLIRPAVELLNQIPGVITQYSCQGVSGKVQFEGRDLLVVSEHEEHAYVSFSVLEQPAKEMIEALLPDFPSITDVSVPGNFALRAVLRSTGDNLCFRTELIALAKRVLDRVAGQEAL